MFTFLSSSHLLSSFLLFYINYLFPQSTTSGSCFPFPHPFITPLHHSISPVFLSLFFTISRSLRRLYSRLSIPLIRVLIIQPSLHHSPHSPLLPSLPSFFPLLLPLLLLPAVSPPSPASLSGVSPNFHTAQQPAGLPGSYLHLLKGKHTHTHMHTYTQGFENIHTFKHRHAHTFLDAETYRSRKIST